MSKSISSGHYKVVMANVDEELCSVPKRQKLEEHKENSKSCIHESLADLSTFKLEKIVHNNTNRKTVCLKGKFASNSENALVLLEKTAFAEENLTKESDYFKSNSLLKKVFHNDIYGNYIYLPEANLNSIKATIIHPATEKHFQKYSVQNCFIVEETPEIYKNVVLPHVSEKFTLDWVYNILEHKSESERIVFEDPDPVNGFILLPDLKWNGEIDTLYLLAIVHDRAIQSLRDLTFDHLPLLKNIKKKGTEAIKSKYGLDSSELRIYLHYQPSFYHLHVHFTYLKHEAPGILAERAHLLSSVISNIELLPNYYQKITIPFVVRENDALYNKLKELPNKIRPRLQSVNALIHLNIEINDLKVILNEDGFEIFGDKNYTVTCKHLKIVPNSLSSVNVTNSVLSFHFSTSNSLEKLSGSFKVEVLKSCQASSKDCAKLELFKTSMSYSIQCKICAQSLSNPVKFERILPLPSENLEPSEWFCHNHDASVLLEPKEFDFFYTKSYFYVNKSNVQNILESDNLVICQKCLGWLGHLQKSSIKFWFHTVALTNDGFYHTTSPLEDVFYTLRNILNDVLYNTVKILLCCKKSKNETDYILVWILDKQLRVQFCKNGDFEDCEVAKVLFKYEKHSNEEVKKWCVDPNVISLQISKPMTTALLKHLYKYYKINPKGFSTSNDFLISYLFMYENKEFL